MRLEQLAGSGRAPTLPLNLTLAGDELRVELWLRVLPGQRYVGLARWRGRAVLAKLLVGGKAERHFRRELDGARLLAEQALLTPELLAEGFAQGQGGWLLFEIGEGQDRQIGLLFQRARAYEEIGLAQNAAGTPRVAFGRVKAAQ